jgi:hypothetical protein
MITKLFKLHLLHHHTHVDTNTSVFETSRCSHNLGEMNTSSGGKGRKRHVNLDDFTFDPTTMNPNDGKKQMKPFLNLPGQQGQQPASVLANPTLSNNKAMELPAVIELHSVNGAKVTQPMVSNRTNVHPEDMTLSVSTRGLNIIIKDCVKLHLFRKMKFFDKGKHGSYSTSPKTVCGLVMKHCNISSVQADHKWWDKMRSAVMRTHTDHRNNCIKAMRIKFRGKCNANNAD